MTALLAALARLFSPITRLGWTILAGAAAAWWLGSHFGWKELSVISAAGLIAVSLAVATTLGRLGLDVTLGLNKPRVSVGEDAIGTVEVAATSSRPSLGSLVEVPVGQGTAVFEVGSLRRGEPFREIFTIPTNRRSVVTLGPARSVKGDPLGIARREVVNGDAIDLYVHPRTVRLPSLTAGWLRDLEGRTTNDLSTSDVAFHTLREYVPGDDRRHIHWRTTARLGTMMVRQFVDTRRSHLGLLLSVVPTDWAGDEEFELGVSVVGSLGRTALMDDQEVTAFSGAHSLPAFSPNTLLDGLAAVELDPDAHDLTALVRRSVPFVRGVSVLALVVGAGVDRRALRAACETFDKDVQVLAIRCAVGAAARRQRIANVSLLDVGGLDDLTRVLLRAGVA